MAKSCGKGRYLQGVLNTRGLITVTMYQNLKKERFCTVVCIKIIRGADVPD